MDSTGSQINNKPGVVMRKILLPLIVTASLIGVAAGAQESDAGSFEQVKAKTFEKKKFMFPGDVRGTELNILFLAMSADRDSGEAQQLALIDWHVALAERGVFSDAVMPYHFPVLAGVPFFVKGMITRAMKESYEGKVPLDQASVLFIKDLPSFAASAGLTIDDQPTIVITTSDAKPLQSFKGELSPEGLDEIVAAIDELKQ
jgi:hypothetical protein